MRHDFRGLNPTVPRYAQDGRTSCTFIGSIMDYVVNNNNVWKNMQSWSKCSKEDLTSYYNRAGGSSSFCLNTNTGSLGWVICVF